MGQTQGGEEKEVSLQEIQELYRKFASECPSGNLHLHEFKRIFGINSSSTVEETAYMEIVFESFDTNKVRKQKKQKKGDILGRFHDVSDILPLPPRFPLGW